MCCGQVQPVQVCNTETGAKKCCFHSWSSVYNLNRTSPFLLVETPSGLGMFNFKFMSTLTSYHRDTHLQSLSYILSMLLLNLLFLFGCFRKTAITCMWSSWFHLKLVGGKTILKHVEFGWKSEELRMCDFTNYSQTFGNTCRVNNLMQTFCCLKEIRIMVMEICWLYGTCA